MSAICRVRLLQYVKNNCCIYQNVLWTEPHKVNWGFTDFMKQRNNFGNYTCFAFNVENDGMVFPMVSVWQYNPLKFLSQAKYYYIDTLYTTKNSVNQLVILQKL